MKVGSAYINMQRETPGRGATWRFEGSINN